MHQKKVLIFGVFPPPITGQTIANQTTFEILKDGYDVRKLNLTFNNKVRPVEMKGMTLFRYALKTNVSFIKNVFKLKKELKGFSKEDVVFFNVSPTTGGKIKEFLFILFMYTNNIRLIGVSHNAQFVEKEKSLLLSPINFLLKKRVNNLIFNSYIFYNKSSFPENKKTVFYNTIRTQVILNGNTVNQAISAKRNKPLRILFLSNLIRTKGIVELLDALILLKEKGVVFTAKIIGAFDDGNTKEIILGKLNQLSDSTELLKPIYDTEIVKNIYLESHIFVLPTYYPNEMQPLSIIEAENAGCVIISTPHATIPEMIDDNVNGFLVDKKNADAIFKAIQILDEDRDKLMEMAKASRNIFEDKFSQKKMKENFIELFG